MKEAVNHPDHYNSHPSGIECIEIVRHMNFNCGNAVKYIWRADHKHQTPIEDLKKAAFYIADEIARLERLEPDIMGDCMNPNGLIPIGSSVFAWINGVKSEATIKLFTPFGYRVETPDGEIKDVGTRDIVAVKP